MGLELVYETPTPETGLPSWFARHEKFLRQPDAVKRQCEIKYRTCYWMVQGQAESAHLVPQFVDMIVDLIVSVAQPRDEYIHKGKIYIVEDFKGVCKIGWSAQVKTRLKVYKNSIKQLHIFDMEVQHKVEKKFHSTATLKRAGKNEFYKVPFKTAIDEVTNFLRSLDKA